MFDIEKDNRCVSIVSRPGVRNLLITMLDQLQRCQKSLNEFLEVSPSFHLTISRFLRISFIKNWSQLKSCHSGKHPEHHTDLFMTSNFYQP